MRRIAATAVVCLAAMVAISPKAARAQAGIETRPAPATTLRMLDRISGTVIDVDAAAGQTLRYGTLEISAQECRYPLDNPTGDAFAYLVIHDSRTVVRDDADAAPIFAGWMIASSPAIMALDHPRYDVWVLGCPSTSDQ